MTDVDIDGLMDNKRRQNRRSKQIGELLDKLESVTLAGVRDVDRAWTIRVDRQGDLIIRVYEPGVMKMMEVMEIIHDVGCYGYYFDGDKEHRMWMEIVVFMDRWTIDGN